MKSENGLAFQIWIDGSSCHAQCRAWNRRRNSRMSRLARIVMALMLLTGMIVGLSGGSVAAQDNQTGQRGGDDSTPTTDDNESGTAGSYTSPTYGYSISYDESWTLASEDSQGGYDTVELDSDGSIFY